MSCDKHGAHERKSIMDIRNIVRVTAAVFSPLSFLAITAESGGYSALAAASQRTEEQPHCVSVGGSISTNLAVIDANTTLGTATGDLKGALAANILSISQVGNNTLFSVQHHWVTESGETLVIDKTTATSTQVAPGLLAITDYPVHISSGTGKFTGATGDLQLIGEVDLNVGRTIFRYTGKLCFAERDDR
jgi:hypothetical protein